MDSNLLNSLASIIDARCLSGGRADREAHARDESFHAERLPDVVVWPDDTSEVSRILRWANEHEVPVTAWGGGSSLEGNPIPVRGGIVLDMTRMNRVLEVMAEDFQVRVQPGIIADDLNSHLRRYGLFFPAAPGSSDVATVGGMIANNAGGMYAIKYGVVRDHVMALEVALADGEVIRLGNRSIKTVAGYDLVSLFVGSEGTLGIITEATLRLRGLPQSSVTILATFTDAHQAVNAALDIWGSGLEPAALELMDAKYVRLANQARDMGWHEAPTLLIELHGMVEGLEVATRQVGVLCQSNNGAVREVATTTQTKNRLWEGRRGLRLAVRGNFPDTGIALGDVGVPLSKIPDLIHKAQEIGATYDIRTVIFGHAGDGNFHVWALYSLADEGSRKRAARVNEELVRYAIQVGGTATAEHGVGIGKRKFLRLEHASSIEVMAGIKRLLDPKGILNPGKIFPD
jgi:D-lactate dehydrogenase (cytochrome)